MSGFRVRGIQVGSLDDAELSVLLQCAEDAGGVIAFPVLFSLIAQQPEVAPDEMLDELARLGEMVAGREAGQLIGRMRDDLMQGLATAEEG